MRPRTAVSFSTIAALLLAAACNEGGEPKVARDAAQSTAAEQATLNDAAGVPVVVPRQGAGFAGGVAGQSAKAEAMTARRAMAPAPDAPASPGAADPSDVSAVTMSDSAGAAGAAGARVVPDMVIRSGTASVEVDSLDAAVTRVRQLASRVGGIIANSSLQSGHDQLRAATLEIKVAASRWDELVNGLTPLGEVEAVNVSAEEVGEEYVDVSARVANARRLEARLIDLLAHRTGRLSDVLTVERELARVREEIERYEGRLRYLRTRSAVSTLAVTVHEPPPVVARHPGTNPIAEAFVQAWRNFVGLTAVVIASLGVLVPLAAVAALGWVAWRKVRKQAAGRGQQQTA